jgi:hypothetical protein
MACKRGKTQVKMSESSPRITLTVGGRHNFSCLSVYLGQSTMKCHILRCILHEGQMRWVPRQKMTTCEMGMANLHACGSKDFVTVDGMA